MYLSKPQIRLLRKISKKDVIRTDRWSIADIEYLRSNDLVTVAIADKPDDFYYHPHITEKGKAVLYERKHQNRRANIALVISILAIILSLLTAFTPFPEWSKEWITYLFQTLAR